MLMVGAKNTIQKLTRELCEAVTSDKTGLFRYNSL